MTQHNSRRVSSEKRNKVPLVVSLRRFANVLKNIGKSDVELTIILSSSLVRELSEIVSDSLFLLSKIYDEGFLPDRNNPEIVFDDLGKPDALGNSAMYKRSSQVIEIQDQETSEVLSDLSSAFLLLPKDHKSFLDFLGLKDRSKEVARPLLKKRLTSKAKRNSFYFHKRKKSNRGSHK